MRKIKSTSKPGNREINKSDLIQKHEPLVTRVRPDLVGFCNQSSDVECPECNDRTCGEPIPPTMADLMKSDDAMKKRITQSPMEGTPAPKHYKCKVCSQEFDDFDTYYGHSMSIHNIVRLTQGDLKIGDARCSCNGSGCINTPSGKRPCPICNKPAPIPSDPIGARKRSPGASDKIVGKEGGIADIISSLLDSNKKIRVHWGCVDEVQCASCHHLYCPGCSRACPHCGSIYIVPRTIGQAADVISEELLVLRDQEERKRVFLTENEKKTRLECWDKTIRIVREYKGHLGGVDAMFAAIRSAFENEVKRDCPHAPDCEGRQHWIWLEEHVKHKCWNCPANTHTTFDYDKCSKCEEKTPFLEKSAPNAPPMDGASGNAVREDSHRSNPRVDGKADGIQPMSRAEFVSNTYYDIEHAWLVKKVPCFFCGESKHVIIKLKAKTPRVDIAEDWDRDREDAPVPATCEIKNGWNDTLVPGYKLACGGNTYHESECEKTRRTACILCMFGRSPFRASSSPYSCALAKKTGQKGFCQPTEAEPTHFISCFDDSVPGGWEIFNEANER